MSFSAMLERMRSILTSSGILHELAVSALKMMNPLNIGDQNKVWQEGPVLVSPANKPPLSHEYPYVLKTGKLNQYIIALLNSDLANKFKSHQDLPMGAPLETHPESYIGHSSIIQFYFLLEEYEFSCIEAHIKRGIKDIDTEKYSLKQIIENGIDSIISGRASFLLSVYSRKPVVKRIKEWDTIGLKVPREPVIRKYDEMSSFRNMLAHQRLTNKVLFQTAIEFYYFSALIGKEIGSIFGDTEAMVFSHPFKLFGEKEDPDVFLFEHRFK